MRNKKHRDALRQKTQQQFQGESTTAQQPKRRRKKSGGCGCGKKRK